MAPKRRFQVNVRVSEEETRAIDEAARAAGLATSEWVRVVLRHAAGLQELAEQLGRVR